MSGFDELVEELKNHLDSSRQNWLFGAGISCDGNIPLMYPLTDRVESIIKEGDNDKDKEIYDSILSDLDESAHVEHYLSHLGDLIAIAERVKGGVAIVNGQSYTQIELRHLHGAIVSAIGGTVRYGYKKTQDDEVIGTADEPIVEIAPHVEFVKGLFRSRANLKSRSRLTFFTTNYDTLLEDALALEKYIVVDGFSGGAVGFWNAEKEFSRATTDPERCLVYKLHGSIDWIRDEDRGLLRNRYGTKYLSNPSDIMIYPQATKYVETQKDPFASLFSGLRSSLNVNEDNVLVFCGYSFMDAHINSEIEAALKSSSNKTNVVAFVKEAPNDGVCVNPALDAWLQNSGFGKRVFVVGEKGVYHNSLEPVSDDQGKKFTWWTFAGLTEFINTGEVL